MASSGSPDISGHTWTPRSGYFASYDPDGNLKSDGRWDYSWNAENRLTRMTTTTAAANAGVPRQQLEFVYDSQGRRVAKNVTTSTDGAIWTFASSMRFLYDGWNLIAEYSAPSTASTTLTLQASHTWGIDLSGTMQGAGGVGGLLCSSLNSQPSTLNFFPSYDGNGNISAWIDATGNLLERMDYSPFGRLITCQKIGSSEVLSRLNFGFSTKFTDSESGLLYYGYRFYDPVTGRWPSRDPIEERGGVNLYGFVINDPIGLLDVLGGNPFKYTPSFHRNPSGSGTDIATAAGTAASVITGDIFSRSDPVPNYKPGQCRFLITVTGIWMKKNGKDTQNAFLDEVQALPAFSSIPNPVKANNPTNFGPQFGDGKQTHGLGDVVQILVNEIPSLITIADRRLAQQVKGAADAAKKNNCSCWCIYIVAHSQGTMVAKQGLKLIDEDTRKHVAFLGLGGETTIGPESGIPAGQSRNYADAYDPVRVNGGLGGWSPWNDGPDPETIHEWQPGKNPEGDGFADAHSWDEVYLPWLRKHPEALPDCSRK